MGLLDDWLLKSQAERDNEQGQKDGAAADARADWWHDVAESKVSSDEYNAGYDNARSQREDKDK